MHTFTLVFLVALAAHAAAELWLARRQAAFVAANRNAVPAAFAQAVTGEDHAKAADYTIAKQRLRMVETVYDAAILVWLTVGGGIAWIGSVTGAGGFGPLATGTLLVVFVFSVLTLLGLPFGIYRTFVLEHRFGFNRSRPATYVSDLAKGWSLGLLLGGTVVACILWIMSDLGQRWWIAAWLTWSAFTLVITWAWPRLIAPIFNRFTPLEDPPMRARIDALLERCGFHAKGVFVMDGSRRSSHGNAYFTGLGREKRIVFFDTLLSRLSPPQVESVLAHELAHFRLHHVPQRMAFGLLASLAGFALLGWLSGQDWFYSALGVPQRSDAAALVLFVLVTPAFAWVVTPLAAAWSRHHEYQADAFAAEHSDAKSLAEALVKLYRDNASTLTPDPVHSVFYDSHPPPAARIARLESLDGRSRAGAARA